MTTLRIGICVDKDNVSRTSHVLRRTLQTQLEKLLSNKKLLKVRSRYLIHMESEPEIRRWHQQGPKKPNLKAEQYPMLSGIAVVCPSPGCGLAFVQLDALGVHANQKHGMKLKISSCEVKSDERKLKKMQSYRGRKVSEGLRSYHRKRRMASLPQEDFSPLLAQADQLLAAIKTQPRRPIPPLQRLHYRLHPPPIFPQSLHSSDHRQDQDTEYQMPPPCLLFNPNTSQYQRHPLEQASYESDRQHELNQHQHPTHNFTNPMLPSFPSTFQHVGVQVAGQEGPNLWYQMPESTNSWITTAVDTVEADQRTYRVL